MESGERGSKPLCVHHLQVAQDLAGFACTVVERAARMLDHFAPPSAQSACDTDLLRTWTFSFYEGPALRLHLHVCDFIG